MDLSEIYEFIYDHESLDTVAQIHGIKLFMEDCVAENISKYPQEEFLAVFRDEALIELDDKGVSLVELRGDLQNLYEAIEILVYSKFPKGAVDDFKNYGFKIGKWLSEYEAVFETFTGSTYPADHPAVAHRTRAELPLGSHY